MVGLATLLDDFSPATRARLRAAGAYRDPAMTCAKPELESALTFEERYGGLRLGNTVYGAYAALTTDATWSTPPDDEEPHLVPISRTGDSALFIGVGGQIWLLELIAMPDVVPYAACFEVVVERGTARMDFMADLSVHQITITGTDVARELAALMKAPRFDEASDDLEILWADPRLTIVSSQDWDRILNGRDGAPMRLCTYIYARDDETVEAVASMLKQRLGAPTAWSRGGATRKLLEKHLPVRYVATTDG